MGISPTEQCIYIPKYATQKFLSQGRSLWWESRSASVQRRVEQLDIQWMCSLIQLINCLCSPAPGNKKNMLFPHNINSQKKNSKSNKTNKRKLLSLFFCFLFFKKRYTGKNVLKRNTVAAVTTPFTTPTKWVSPPSLDPNTPFTWDRCLGTSLPFCVLCVTQIHIRIHSPCFCTSNHLCSERRRALRISSGSVFHLIGSRACWLTAQRWRPHRPFGRHLYSLAGRAARCKRGGGDTLDTCLSVYCSLGNKQVNRRINSEIKPVQHVCMIFVPKNEFGVLHISYSSQSLTSQVEFCKRVSGGWAHCSQQVDGVVSEAVAVGEVQFC